MANMRRRFVDDAFETAAAEIAAELRNDAEGTRMVAAFGDLYVSGVARGGEDALSEIVIQVRRRRELLWCQRLRRAR